ncbi:MAG: KH domain-containing protein [Actinomycetota bacterium]|nr:KH domain-containing protein [Actinomycetota bacterium]
MSDLDLEDEAADGNRLEGAVPRTVLEYVAKSIVDDPEAVVVEVEEGRGSVSLRLHVAPSDMGRVIGRRGRVAQAIRTVVRAAGAKEGVETDVDIVD